MKIDDRKSINQSISIDDGKGDWHRPIDDQSIITNKISLIGIDCHRLLSISHGVHGHPHDKSPGYREIDFRNPKTTDHA